MHNLESRPLCQQSDLYVFRPPLDFFIHKIRNNENFSFTRQMHGLWDGIIAAWILKPELRSIRIDDRKYIANLAFAMSEAKEIIDDLHYEPKFYEELIEILRNLDGSDTSFMFGVSDTYFFPKIPPPYSTETFALPSKCFFKLLPTNDNLNYYKVRFEDRQNVIKLLLPSKYPFFDAMIWKLYSYNNEIWSLFKEVAHHPIVLVGPAHYSEFGKLASLRFYHHIEIHGNKASKDRELILKQVEKKHEEFQNSSSTPIYFFVAGSVSVYWVHHLHKKLSNKFLIDVGQAFNFLFEKKMALMHREFGYSQSKEKGRKQYNEKKLYGNRSFQSSMKIVDNQVNFDLKLRLSDIWFEKLITLVSKYLINLYTIKRLFYKTKHRFYSFFK